MKKNNILTFVVIFLLVNLVYNFFFNNSAKQPPVSQTVSIAASRNDFELGNVVTAEIKNNTFKTATIKNECPEEPLDILFYNNGQWIQKTKNTTIPCDGTGDIVIKPGEQYTVSYSPWNHALFGELGRYKIRSNVVLTPISNQNSSTTQNQTQENPSQQTVNSQAITQQNTLSQASSQQTQLITTTSDNTIETKTIESTEFEIKPEGWLGWIWTTIFYQPLYNVLIFCLSIVPGNDLGLAIILLTILIRTILLVPSQNALKSQRKMQEIQPKLAKLKEKYKDNQEMLAKETMAIWKENKVNPFGSCLPLLIQFPVLIGLFYVVQNGLNPDNAYLLYNGLQTFSFTKINVNFLGILDLTKINTLILPLIVGGLQFLQMKLSFIHSAKAKKEQQEKQHREEKKQNKNEMEMANNMMTYIMPIMIGVFTASVPAGVGLYWGISTLYGIGQQIVVNKQSSKNKATVRVLNSEQPNR